jgi:hypothetical protein
MRHAQQCTKGILEAFAEDNNTPKFITFETNGTQTLADPFFEYMDEVYDG